MPLVFAGVCSHVPGITGRAERADPALRDAFYAAFGRMRQALEEARPDALVVIAAEHFAKEDPGLRGRITQLGEMSIVLQVFGQRAPDGTKFFTFKDAEQLFVHGQIPSSWSPPAVPGKVSIPDVLGGTAMGLFRQFINGK